jgi:hypothetical protein
MRTSKNGVDNQINHLDLATLRNLCCSVRPALVESAPQPAGNPKATISGKIAEGSGLTPLAHGGTPTASVQHS